MLTKEQAVLDEIVEQQQRAENDFRAKVRSALARIKNASVAVQMAQLELDNCKKQLRDMSEPEWTDYKELLAE